MPRAAANPTRAVREGVVILVVLLVKVVVHLHAPRIRHQSPIGSLPPAFRAGAVAFRPRRPDFRPFLTSIDGAMTATAPARSQSSYFWLCLAVSSTVFYGFSITYFQPMLAG